IGPEGAHALARNTVLRKLCLGGVAIGDEGAAAFEHNRTLRRLEVSSSGVTTAGALALARNNTLTYLDLNWNPGIQPFAAATALSRNTALVSLILESRCTFGLSSLTALVQNTTLTYVSLTRMNDEETEICESWLARNQAALAKRRSAFVRT